MKDMRLIPRFALVILLTTSTPVLAGVIHVPGDQPTIQAGIDAASAGDTVLVADGVYAGSGNKDLDFGGRAIVVESEHGPQTCIIDCQESGRGFYFHSGESAESVLRGFTIRNGYIMDNGGGICCMGASPTITHNIIIGNTIDGGGVYSFGGAGIACYEYSSPFIGSNTITDNRGPDGIGGGIGIWNYSDPIVVDNLIADNWIEWYGAGIAYGAWSAPLIANNTITGNTVYYYGGGISLGNPTYGGIIYGNRITNNTAAMGGGLYAFSPDLNVVIEKNSFTGNHAVFWPDWDDPANAPGCGGGIYCQYCGSSPMLLNDNRIIGNLADFQGGGLWLFDSHPTITNCLISDNTAEFYPAGGSGLGGAIMSWESSPAITNCTMSGNTAHQSGGAIYTVSPDRITTVTNSILWGNGPNEIIDDGIPSSVTYSDIQNGFAGEGNSDADPLLVQGSLGDFFLSHTDTGHGTDSPCLDAGNPASAMIAGTTRTDCAPDIGIVDMGYHYPLEVAPRLVAGPGPRRENPPLVRIIPLFEDPDPAHEFSAYASAHYGVNVACGDVNGDLVPEIVTGPGPGRVLGPHVRGFRADGAPLPGLSFMAYGTNRYGVNVALADLDGDGSDEIITGAGPGAVYGPHVRGFRYDEATASVSPMPGVSLMTYGTNKWGVNVAGGDIDGDGFDEIVTGAGPGAVFGPHVRGWNVEWGPARAIPAVSFFAYGTNRFGVEVACGDVDGDGIDEIITAPGPGVMFGAHVRGWNCDGATLSQVPGCSFLAWPSSLTRYGAEISSGLDFDSDGLDEIIVGAGPDPSVESLVKVYRYTGGQVAEWSSLQAFPAGWTHGVNVAAGEFGSLR